MEETNDKINQSTDEPSPEEPSATTQDQATELEVNTDKWKRALAEAENARKRDGGARLDGREHGAALAVEALAPAYDDICLAITAAHSSPDADAPSITAQQEGLNKTKAAFETGLQALGLRLIAPRNTPFDPVLHDAMETQETDKTEPGEVLVLHRPGFALGKRLIRPAHVTVGASPSKPAKD